MIESTRVIHAERIFIQGNSLKSVLCSCLRLAYLNAITIKGFAFFLHDSAAVDTPCIMLAVLLCVTKGLVAALE